MQWGWLKLCVDRTAKSILSIEARINFQDLKYVYVIKREREVDDGPACKWIMGEKDLE